MATLTPEILTAQLKGLFQSWDASAVVIPRRVLGVDDDGFDRDFLRSGSDGDLIRAVAFWVSGLDTETLPALSTGKPTGTPRKCLQAWTIQVRLFREYQTGSDLVNAELAFVGWAADCARYLAARPYLGIEGYQVNSHEDLQFPSPRLAIMGSLPQSLLLQASGQLRISAYYST